MGRALPSGAGATTELDAMEVEARALSAERNDLHYRIDRLYQSTPLHNEQLSLLDRLEEREQVVSLERRDLHLRIDGLRAELGLPNWRKARLSHTPTGVNLGLRGPSPGAPIRPPTTRSSQ